METQETKKRGRPKGCHQCKKKKEITKLDIEPIDVQVIMMPTNDDIKLAYYEVTNQKGVQEDKKNFISYVYESVMKEPFDWSCNSCGNTQVRKLEAYIKKNNIKL